MNSMPPPLPPEPPPFGDPSRVRQENSAAVTKGVLFGCGGCLAVILLFAGLGAAIFVFVFGMLKGSDATKITLEAARRSPELRASLGEPMEVGWIVTGSVQSNGSSGSADLNVTVEGPKGSSSVHTVGKSNNGVWTFSKMEATVPTGGPPVDLRQHLP